MRLFLFVFIAAVICPACKKNNVNERDKVEIYLLYQLLNKKIAHKVVVETFGLFELKQI
jgi:hypothetical protein